MLHRNINARSSAVGRNHIARAPGASPTGEFFLDAGATN